MLTRRAKNKVEQKVDDDYGEAYKPMSKIIQKIATEYELR